MTTARTTPSQQEVYDDLGDALGRRSGESLFDAAVRVVNAKKQRTPIRLAAHAVLDTPRVYGIWMRGLRRALRFAQTTSQPPEGR